MGFKLFSKKSLPYNSGKPNKNPFFSNFIQTIQKAMRESWQKNVIHSLILIIVFVMVVSLTVRFGHIAFYFYTLFI